MDLGEQHGKCHICKLPAAILFCEDCQHWFCADCRSRWFARGFEFVMQKVRGRMPGCCGPRS